MKKISRKIFNENISDADAVKALALLIFVKTKFPTSVVPNFSFYKMKKLTGLHINTIKERINTLGAMELIDMVGKYNQHMIFKKVRAPKSNVNFSMIDTSSVKSIELGLRALFLQEKVCQKNLKCQTTEIIKARRYSYCIKMYISLTLTTIMYLITITVHVAVAILC